jgi:hypothetical protein
VFKLALALRNDDATLQQNRSQLINQSRPFGYEPGSDPVKRLHVELILALEFDEPHRWTARRLGNCFGLRKAA